MDRIFLGRLAREIEASARGARVRSLRIRSPLGLSLRLNRGALGDLVFRLGPGVAGLYLDDSPPPRGTPSDRETKLSRLLDGAELSSLVAAPDDRRVRVTLDSRRPSGRRRAFAVELELFATKRALFLLDADSGLVVDVLATGEPRHRAGERYVEPAAPMGARSGFASREDFERGLSESSLRRERVSLGLRCGLTPLLSRELLHQIDTRRAPPGELYEELLAELGRSRPVAYLEDGGITLSPIPLDSHRNIVSERFDTFNGAMARAARLSSDALRAGALRQRLDTAVGRRLERQARLLAKLSRQQSALADADELRRRGQILLAGIGRAERVAEGRVRLPDPFDVDGADVVIEVDPRFDLPGNAERLFRRARKVDRTRVELTRRVASLELAVQLLEELVLSIADARSVPELEDLVGEAEEAGLVPRPPKKRARSASPRLSGHRRYQGPRSSSILVGRSARGNDELTFGVAKPGDLWFHALGIPGSHVVLTRTPGVPAPEEDVRVAAALAAYFSKSRADDHVDVMVAERKGVSRIPGGAKGLVRVASFRTLRVSPREADDLVSGGPAPDC